MIRALRAFLIGGLFALLLGGCARGMASGKEFQPILSHPPTLEEPVYDGTGTLTSDDLQRLSDACANDPYDDEKPQIAICYLDHLPGNSTVEEAARTIARGWGIGNENRKDGVLLIVAREDKKVRIEVAEGASTVLTDGKSGAILDTYCIDYFKDGEYVDGMAATASAVRSVLSGIEVYTRPSSDGGQGTPSIFENPKVELFFIGVMITLIIITFFLRMRSDLEAYSPSSSSYRTFSSSSSSSSSSHSFGGGGGFSGGGSSRSW